MIGVGILNIFYNHGFNKDQLDHIIPALEWKGYIKKGLDEKYELTDNYINDVKKSEDIDIDIDQFVTSKKNIFNVLSEFQNRKNGETQLFIGNFNKVEDWRKLRDHIKSFNGRVDNIIFDGAVIYFWKPYDKDGFEIISIIYEILSIGGKFIFPKNSMRHSRGIILFSEDGNYTTDRQAKMAHLFEEYIEEERIEIMDRGDKKEYILTKKGKKYIRDKIEKQEDISLDIVILEHKYLNFNKFKEIYPSNEGDIIFELLFEMVKRNVPNGWESVEEHTGEYDKRHTGKGYIVFTKGKPEVEVLQDNKKVLEGQFNDEEEQKQEIEKGKQINIVLGANNMDKAQYDRLYKEGITIEGKKIYCNLFFNNHGEDGEIENIFGNHNFNTVQMNYIIPILKSKGYIQKGLDKKYKVTDYYIDNVKKGTDMNLGRFDKLRDGVFNVLSDFQNKSNGETQLFIGDFNEIESWRRLRNHIRSFNGRVDNIIFDGNVIYFWKPYDGDGFEIISIIYEILSVGGKFIFPKNSMRHGFHIITGEGRDSKEIEKVKLFKEYIKEERIDIEDKNKYILTDKGKKYIRDKIENKDDVSLDIAILQSKYLKFEEFNELDPSNEGDIVFELLLAIMKKNVPNGWESVEEHTGEYDERHTGEGYIVFTKGNRSKKRVEKVVDNKYMRWTTSSEGKQEVEVLQGNKKVLEGKFNDDKERQGVWAEYDSKTGEKIEETEWVNGIKVLEVGYINNKKEGLLKKYYIDGNLRIEGEYKNGDKEGKWKEYDMEGNIKNVENYKKGKKEGKQNDIYYFLNGEKIERIYEYKEGVIQKEYDYLVIIL